MRNLYASFCLYKLDGKVYRSTIIAQGKGHVELMAGQKRTKFDMAKVAIAAEIPTEEGSVRVMPRDPKTGYVLPAGQRLLDEADRDWGNLWG